MTCFGPQTLPLLTEITIFQSQNYISSTEKVCIWLIFIYSGLTVVAASFLISISNVEILALAKNLPVLNHCWEPFFPKLTPWRNQTVSYYVICNCLIELGYVSDLSLETVIKCYAPVER